MKYLIVLLLLLTGCPQPPVCPEPEDPAKYEATCEDACANLERLGCEEAKPTPKGETCVQVCTTTEAANTGVTLNPSCVAKMTACDQIDDCTNSR